MYRIKFIREEKEILVEPGTRILEAERKAKLVPDAPCGGRGKCGKCRVKIEDHMVPGRGDPYRRNAETGCVQA